MDDWYCYNPLNANHGTHKHWILFLETINPKDWMRPIAFSETSAMSGYIGDVLDTQTMMTRDRFFILRQHLKGVIDYDVTADDKHNDKLWKLRHPLDRVRSGYLHLSRRHVRWFPLLKNDDSGSTSEESQNP